MARTKTQSAESNAKKAGGKKKAAASKTPAVKTSAAKKPAAKKPAAKKPGPSSSKKVVGKKAAANSPGKKAAGKKAADRKPAKKEPAKKKPAGKKASGASSASSKAPVKKAAAAKKTSAKPAKASKSTAKKTPAKKAPAKKAPAKKAPAKKPAGKKASASKSAPKKAPAAKKPAKKSTKKSAAAKQAQVQEAPAVVAPPPKRRSSKFNPTAVTKPVKKKKRVERQKFKVPVGRRAASRQAGDQAPSAEVPAPSRPEGGFTPEQLRKVKTGISAKQLAAFRKNLLDHRREILADVAGINAARSHDDGDSHVPLHMADVGSENYDREFNLMLQEEEHKMLVDIDAAIARIDDGTYGVCQDTCTPIGRGRLEYKPWARYGIEAARRREASAKHRGGSST